VVLFFANDDDVEVEFPIGDIARGKVVVVFFANDSVEPDVSDIEELNTDASNVAN
jgi:hypothetical protein